MVRSELFLWNLLPTGAGKSPRPCCCQSIVEFEGKLYVFGGANLGNTFADVFSFDMQRSSWRLEVTKNQELVTGRMSHTAVVFEDCMVVYGGMNTSLVHSELLSLNLRTMEWTVLPQNSSKQPGVRRSHAAAVHGHKMYISMGIPALPSPDLWSYDFRTQQWKHLETTQRFGIPPFPLHGHTIATHYDELFLFGGSHTMPSGLSVYLNALYCYSINTGTWQEVLVGEGPRPSPRYSHVMGVSGGRLYIHGGDANNCTTYFDDMWSIDIDSATERQAPVAGSTGVRLPSWRQHRQRGPMRPCARSGHCGVVSSGSLYVFGGEGEGTETIVYYSGGLYRCPLRLSLELPLSELCAIWLSGCLKTTDADSIRRLSPATKLHLAKYMPTGTKEVLAAHRV